VSLTNTFLGMSIDTETRRPRLTNITGGRPDRPSSPLPCAWYNETARAVKIPILGMAALSRRKTQWNSCWPERLLSRWDSQLC